MISYALDLNLIPGGVLPRIDLSQYDHGQSVECDLYKGPVPYTIPSGSVAYVEGTKPDKTGFQYEATIASNKVTFEVTNQMTACGGEVVTELVLTHSGDRIATINFILNVEPAALANDTIISETDLPIVQQIPEYMEQIGEYAEEAEAWATGGEEGTPSATNNSKYWAEMSQQYAIGAFHWKAKVVFVNLPTSNLTVGDVYEVADSFTTDSRFSEGVGVKCDAGTEIVWTNGNKWSILTPPGVVSFNGRKGTVTPASGDYSASQITRGTSNVGADLDNAEDRINLNGCRNILYPTETASIIQNGVTMTCNNDGSITLSGSNTAGHSITLHPFPHISGRLFLHKGLYKLGGDPVGGRIRSNGSTLAYFEIRVSGNGGSATAIVADSNTATWDEFDLNNDVLNSAIESISVTLVVNTAANFGSGMTIYPTLVTSSTDGVTGYEQGELNNRELSIVAKENAKAINTLSTNLLEMGFKVYQAEITKGQTKTFTLPSASYWRISTFGSGYMNCMWFARVTSSGEINLTNISNITPTVTITVATYNTISMTNTNTGNGCLTIFEKIMYSNIPPMS